MKTIIERGASWTLEETKLLLALWGQDLVARQATKLKRTKEVYESISDKFLKEGYERTPDQVRTRVFNMIAEYRRILKDPNPERKQKCVFFEPLDKIYQAKHLTDVKSAIDEYELVNPYSPESISRVSISSCDGGLHNVEDSNDDNSNSTLNNTSSNNNNVTTGAAKPYATTSETTKTTNNIGGSNSKTSATNDSTDNTPVKKPPTSREGQSTTKKLKTDSPKAGTSFGGDTTMDDSFVSVDSKMTIKGGSTNHNASSSTSNITPTATTTFTNNASTSSASGAKQQQQSLLANAGTSSSTTTPINKAATNSAAFININSGAKLPMFRSQILGHTNGNEAINMNGTQAPTARLPTTAAITSHQLYQAPVNTFDVTSSALLIDRMFAHLSKESENMREWIALEKERIALERARRSQETEREIRRERVLVETLMKFQEQWLTFVRRIDPRIEEGAAGPLPELNIPKEVLEPLNIDHKGGALETSVSKANQSSVSPATKTSTSASSTSPVNATSSSSSSTNTSMNSIVSTITTTAPTTTTSTSSAASDRPPVKSY